MSTPYQTVYDAFLAKVQDDEWAWYDDEATVLADWKSILDSAIVNIKFPRVALTQDANGFINTLGDAEIQLIANYMKVEWISRTITTWENIKAQYSESDFSQANVLDKLTKLLTVMERKAEKLQHNYYRSVNGASYPYSNLAGDV